jgi:hypothetical protein
MEFTSVPVDLAGGAQEPGGLKTAESAKEFDELYSMDALKLTESAGNEAVPSLSTGGKLLAGSTFPKSAISQGRQAAPHSFSECDGSSFSLRVGPNYAKTGNKAPAGPCLYEAIGAE